MLVMMLGVYIGQYELMLGEADVNFEDNVCLFFFIVIDMFFQCDSGEGLGGICLVDDNDFSYGNVYYVVNGENFFVCYVIFGVSNFDEVVGFVVFILFYEWIGDFNGDGQVVGDEFDGLIVFNSYVFMGEEIGFLVIILVDIDENFFVLKDDIYYIIVVQFVLDDDDFDLFLSMIFDIDYFVFNFYQDFVGNKVIFYVVFDVSNVNEFLLVGFGLDNILVVCFLVGFVINSIVV